MSNDGNAISIILQIKINLQLNELEVKNGYVCNSNFSKIGIRHSETHI